MSSVGLTPVSYVVLGLVSEHGPSTPYDLKRVVALSIGNFWSFPHSQLYAEPARLAAAGLLEELREETGRRRKTYSITRAGREALGAWLREPVDYSLQVRDLALLKLFFGAELGADKVAELARAQELVHGERLADYEAIAETLGEGGSPHARATLRMGMLCEQAFVEFWSAVAATPPGGAAPPAARAGSRTSRQPRSR